MHTFFDTQPASNKREDLLPFLAQRLNFTTPLLNRFVRLSAREVGLKAPRDLFILTMIAHRPFTQAELIKILDLNAPTLSKQVDALVQSGYITREQSADDRRATILSITPKGIDILAQTSAVNKRLLSEMLAEATDEELIGLLDATNTLSRLITQRMASHNSLHCSHPESHKRSHMPHSHHGLNDSPKDDVHE